MLVFSSKFPAFLQKTTSAMHAKASQVGNIRKVLLIERLASDKRMDAVWTELTKRERSNHKPTTRFFRRAIPPAKAPAMPAELAQAKALEELFYLIVIEVERSRDLSTDPVPGVADLLLQEAGRLQCDKSSRSKSGARQLSRAAKVISSARKANPAREVALGLAAYFEERFGDLTYRITAADPMYGITATIVTVALEVNVTKAMVRNWYATSVLKGGQNDQLVAHS
jgi:hypothetical protein